MTDEYDFSGLTPKQQELLTFEGWSVHDVPRRSQPGARTVRKLIERGLLKKTLRWQRVMYVTEYFVPLGVHQAWCEYCSKHFKGD